MEEKCSHDKLELYKGETSVSYPESLGFSVYNCKECGEEFWITSPKWMET